MLQLLDEGWNFANAASALGTFPREIRRVAIRYEYQGLEAALTDDERPKPPRKLDAKQEARIVAMVCSKPPEAYARWTLPLIAQEARRRGIAAVGRETIRQLLARHELKPWREKNVVRPTSRRRVRREDGGRSGHPREAMEPA